MSTLKSEMAEYVSDSASKQVLLTETNSSNYLDGQVDAESRAPLNESAWIENGASQVDSVKRAQRCQYPQHRPRRAGRL